MKFLQKYNQDGFTAVELLVTIIVAAMFAISFYQLFLSINQASSQSRNRATASDIAYNNMRRFASAGVTPDDWLLQSGTTGFVCDPDSGAANENDVTKNTSATGTTLLSGTLNATTAGLAAPVTYSVKALAIFGCSGTHVGKPIRVESQVTYGPANTVVEHATLVGY